MKRSAFIPNKQNILKILSYEITIILTILLPVVVFTLITSQTRIIPQVRSFIVISGSMEPTLPVGSLIYTWRDSSYAVGDIIAFESADGKTVTHRISAITKDNAFITKGDANKSQDKIPVMPSRVIGKAVLLVPNVGYFIQFLKTPLGFILFIILPTIAYICMELWTIKKEIEKSVEKRVLQRIHAEQKEFIRP